MSVLDGPRREVRGVVVDGRHETCRVEGGRLFLEDGREVPADAVHLPPVIPTTIVCVHLNYRSRAEEFGVPLDGAHPTYFLKPASAINAHGGVVARPADCQLLNYEGEIAAIVGKPMRRVRPDQVWDCLAGFSCANDFGVHDFRDTDAGSMLRVKGQDGFCPIGPGVVRGVDIRRSTLRTFVNGEKVQEGAVADMVWGIDELIADLTRNMTLRPGDVVLTGTPWHSRPVFPGDVVTVEVEGVGSLTNRVVESEAPENFRGFPATVTKTSLGVALGSDYHVLKKPDAPPTAEQYQRARRELTARNMASGPPPASGGAPMNSFQRGGAARAAPKDQTRNSKGNAMTSTKFIPRAEQVGSLKRSARLIAANEAVYAPGHVAIEAAERARGMDELYAVAEEEARRIVQRQIDIGMDVVTDGEFRRFMFLNSFFDGITGFSSEVSKAKFKAADGSVIEWNMQYVVDRLQQVDSPAAREAKFMSGITDHLYKVTFPAGSFLALPYNYNAKLNGHAYASHRELVEHVVAIEKKMIRDVVQAGCRYVQLDFPVYPFLCDPDWRARMEHHGFDWKETLELAAWADREVVADLPEGVRKGIHVCRGNNQGRYVAEGRLDPVAEALFSLPYDSFLIEWENRERMGDFSALRQLPAGDSVVVLGVVSSKVASLESRDSLLSALDEAATYVDPARLAISPQCGFASTLKGNLVTEDDQWRKLELVVDTARRFWS